MYKTETDSDMKNKLMVTKGKEWGGINQEYGITKCILLYIKKATRIYHIAQESIFNII